MRAYSKDNIARSETVGELVLDEMSEKMCDRFLSPNGEFGYHLHVSAALEVGPGARRQYFIVRRILLLFFTSRPNLIGQYVGYHRFWADNGGTLLF